MTRAPEHPTALLEEPRHPTTGFRGIHLLAAVAIVLAAVAVRATEVYTSRYQTLPVVDWLESRPPFAESASLPAAVDLARGLSQALPLLVIRDDARSRLPSFGPPATIQRTVGGVRDAARIVLGTPGDFRPDQVPISARLDTIVFNRAASAASWSQLEARAMDIRDPESGDPQDRLAGPDEPDAVWVASPPSRGGIAIVVGYRGPVGFVLQVSFLHPPDADAAQLVDLTARAEALARQGATDWTAWLVRQPGVA